LSGGGVFLAILSVTQVVIRRVHSDILFNKLFYILLSCLPINSQWPISVGDIEFLLTLIRAAI
jgi:hypothetical protein